VSELNTKEEGGVTKNSPDCKGDSVSWLISNYFIWEKDETGSGRNKGIYVRRDCVNGGRGLAKRE